MPNDFALSYQARRTNSSQSTSNSLPGHAAAQQMLGSIFRLERDGLIRFLARQVGHDLATDLVQEIFLRAVSSPQLDHLVNPRGFLYRIARNVLIDGARRKRCRIITLPLTEGIETRCAAEQEHALEANDLRASLDKALNSLPEKTRRVFVMHRFEDRPYRDIHQELDISVATVEYHMMKALAHIRLAFAPDA